jgi:hypothetical protein
MNDVFDSLGNILNDMISDPSKNNVGWAYEQLFPVQEFAEGGYVEDYIKGIGSAAKQTMSSSSRSDPLGAGFYSSPAHVANSMTNMGKFFHVSNPTEMNVSRFNKDQDASKSPKSEDPNEFYAKWYMSLRRFAEASEVASRGQAGVRST